MKQKFIEVFSELSTSAFGENKYKKESEAQNLAQIVCFALDALNEFGGTCGSRTAYLMKMITDKFDKNDSVGQEVHRFINDINVIVIESNRYVWDFGKISKAIEKIQDEQ